MMGKGRTLSPEPTARQAEILGWIKRFIREQGIPPTTREVANGFRMAAPSAAQAIHSLIRKGFLRRPAKSRRSLQVVDREDGRCDCRAVPVVGEIAAGRPIDAFEQDLGVIHVEGDVLRGGESFALKVIGDSMVEAGILDGDVVVIRKQETADNGDIVVALVDGAATLKRLQVAGARTKLVPANRKMRPIEIATADLTIQGKLVYVGRVL